MKKLYAPWRGDYTNSTARTKNDNASTDECVFCRQVAENNDAKYFILKRSTNTFTILNLYPYNAGHLLILPYAHKETLSTLSQDTRAELMEETSQAIDIITSTLKPDGFNTGLNLGKAAGSGIPSHLHMHVLPRWNSDTNFLPTLGNVKTISFDLHDIYQKLKASFDQL